MSVPNNYNIINENIKDFYSDIFLNDIDEITNQLKNKVKTEDIFNEKSIRKNDIEKHKKLLISNYIIPLTYLIYSYIYIKFYNYQFKNQIIVENKLNYEMYKFVFSHKNPIIRKVNIFLYKYYKDQLHGNKKIDFTIDDVKNGTIKDNTIKFIEDMNNVLKDDTKDLNILKNITSNLEKAILKINNIGEIIKSITNKELEKNTNIYTIIDELSVKKELNIKKFSDYETKYNNFQTSYLELIKTNIKTININILKLSIEIDQNNIIKEDDIKLAKITEIKKIYDNKSDNENKKYENYKEIIEYNIEINQFLNKGKKLINLFFSTNKKNKKINDIIKNIKDNKIDIIEKIYCIILLIEKPNSTSIPNTNTKIEDKIKFIINIKPLKNKLSNQLLNQYIYIYKSIIYYEIIESNYLFKKNNSNESPIYKYENDNENYIEKQKNDFYKLFEKYIDNIIKNNKSKKNILNRIKDDYILKKENLMNDKNIIEERSAQYTKKTQNINNKLTKIEIEIKKLESTKSECIRKQNEISGLRPYGNINEIRKRIKDTINNLPYLKEKLKSDNIQKIKDAIDITTLKIVVNDFFINTINELTNLIETNKSNKASLTTKEKEIIIKSKEYDEIQKNIIETILSNIGLETNNNNSKQNYFNTINKVIKNIDSEKNENEKNIFLDNCNNEFDLLDKILKDINNKIAVMDFNRIDNKLYFLYQKDDINEIYKIYFFNLVNNENNFWKQILEKFSGNAKNKLLKNMKLNNKKPITDDDINIHLMNKIIIDLNKYFIENKEDFLKKIIEIFNNNENNNLVSFLDQYKEYKDGLILKINNLLDKINNNELKLIDIKKINEITNNFVPIIKKKEERIKKIIEHVNDKIDTKGKYTVIIPSTDVLFLYIINLLIIIDFLIHFYE